MQPRNYDDCTRLWLLESCDRVELSYLEDYLTVHKKIVVLLTVYVDFIMKRPRSLREFLLFRELEGEKRRSRSLGK